VNKQLLKASAGTRFTSTYQPGNKNVKKRTLEFKKYLRAEIKKNTIEMLPEVAIEYLDNNFDNPTVFDAILANLISQALNADPRVSFPAAKEIFLRVLGKPVQVHKLEEDNTIEMEEIKSIDLDKFDSKWIKKYEDMTFEAQALIEENGETK